ncbi:MAG: PhzF family phenazine biosynthesis protein [Pirellulales bacterium]|nr:PhzF family phenazine biosynthesis protein [Pirellulales bacterium]
MNLALTTVDAFADQPFSGNPAAVCVLSEAHAGIGDHILQAVAAEMNLAETAILSRVDDGFNLRWFTPTVEVDLCGHATLAAAHVLWEAEYVRRDEPIRFHTRSGLLIAQVKEGIIELDFPKSAIHTVPMQDALQQAMGGNATHMAKTDFDALLEFPDADSVRQLTPDFPTLRELTDRGVIATALSDQPEFDFISRFFAPSVGVDEDPVTGSAHCALAPYWSEKLGKNELVGYQASARGGIVRVRLEGSRCVLGGSAITMLRGDFNLPD